MKEVKLSEEVRAYITNAVKKEIKRDPVAEDVKRAMLLFVGCHPDDGEDRSVLEIYSFCIEKIRRLAYGETELRRKINDIAAPYFAELLIKRGEK